MIPVAIAAGVMLVAISIASARTYDGDKERPPQQPDGKPHPVPTRPVVGPTLGPVPTPRPRPHPKPLPGPLPSGDGWFTRLVKDAIRYGASAKDAVKMAVGKIVTEPDKPATPIPQKDGRPLWVLKNLDGSPGNQMAVPMVRATLAVFKTLQDTLLIQGHNLGSKGVDGRIGPSTVKAFIRAVRSAGFTRYPVTAAQLAANAVKWNEVLQKSIPPDKVGADAKSNFASFAHRASTAPMSAIGPGGRLGHFQLSPKRLEQLGIMTHVVRADDGNGGQIYDGEFAGDLSLDKFLASPRLQLQAFQRSVEAFINDIQSDPGLKSLIGTSTPWGAVTLSGLIALAHAAGWKGAASWLRRPQDRKKFAATTEAFRRLNGMF